MDMQTALTIEEQITTGDVAVIIFLIAVIIATIVGIVCLSNKQNELMK